MNKYLNGKTVFVAGSTGSVGTAVVKHMLDCYSDISICAAYRNTTPHIKDKRVKYRKTDLRSRAECIKAVKGCDCAVMSAGSTYGSGSSAAKPCLQVNDNLIMNAQMLEAFSEENIKRVVFISSATVYQPFEGSIQEDQLDLNKNPHYAHFGVGWVMRCLEKLCAFWHQRYGLEVVIARASNILGPYSKFNPETATFIPALIRKAVDKMDPFEVWGSSEVARDIIYTDDFASSVAAMLNAEDIKFDIFNIGAGRQTTVGDAVKYILKSTGHKPSRIEYKQDKPSSAGSRLIDISKALSKLDWKPVNTTEDVISKTARWWIQNKGVWKK